MQIKLTPFPNDLKRVDGDAKGVVLLAWFGSLKVERYPIAFAKRDAIPRPQPVTNAWSYGQIIDVGTVCAANILNVVGLSFNVNVSVDPRDNVRVGEAGNVDVRRDSVVRLPNMNNVPARQRNSRLGFSVL